MYQHVVSLPSGIILFVKFLFDVCRNILRAEHTELFCRRGGGVREWKVDKGCFGFVQEEYERTSSLTFSILYFDSATDATSTASCCIASDMSAFFMTAFRCSAILGGCCLSDSAEGGGSLLFQGESRNVRWCCEITERNC